MRRRSRDIGRDAAPRSAARAGVASVARLATWLLVAGCADAGDRVRGTSEPIPDAVWDAMQGVTWHPDLPCPPREALRVLRVPYRDFAGATQVGAMIVAADVAEDVLDIFSKIHAEDFRVARMHLASEFGGDDDRSMAANNTSAFNCRLTTSGQSLSEHSHGRAIDINPVQNPYVTTRTTLPPAGRDFDEPGERAGGAAGVIAADDVVVEAFAARGWAWGGDWTSLKDYQHFSVSGR